MRISWQAIQQEALDCLRALVRLDTSNPPGNERIAADYIADALGAHGISFVIREGAPTRANLVARYAGTDSSAGDLLLSSHTDVVPVERSGWTHEAFSGEFAQGCVWGRGSIDMKSKCAMDMVMMTAMKRAGGRPNRDPIQVAEKGFVTIRMKVTAMPGHGSMPRPDTAIARISELITRIVKTPMRTNVSPLMRRTLEEMGVPIDSPGPLFAPMLANTVSPTILRAGYKDNVIPGEATIVLDGRTLPGEDPESFMAELRQIVGPEPTFELLKTAPPAETSPATALFELIKQTVEAADPGARAIAWMIPGATDNKFYSRLGAACYGFSPVKLDAHIPFGSLYHGTDERMPVEGFYWGLKVYAEVVLKFLGIRFDEVFA